MKTILLLCCLALDPSVYHSSQSADVAASLSAGDYYSGLSVAPGTPATGQYNPPFRAVVVYSDCPTCVEDLRREAAACDAFAWDFRTTLPEWGKSLPMPIVHFQVDAYAWKVLREPWPGIERFILIHRDAIAVAQCRPAAAPPVARSGYPVRGANWTFPGSSRADLIDHLLRDGIHRGRFSREYLERLSFAELQSLHSDHHEGRVKAVAAAASAATDKRKHQAQKPGAVQWLAGALFGQRDKRDCPNCPK